MNSLNNFILEKLKISSNSKVRNDDDLYKKEDYVKKVTGEFIVDKVLVLLGYHGKYVYQNKQLIKGIKKWCDEYSVSDVIPVAYHEELYQEYGPVGSTDDPDDRKIMDLYNTDSDYVKDALKDIGNKFTTYYEYEDDYNPNAEFDGSSPSSEEIFGNEHFLAISKHVAGYGDESDGTAYLVVK